MSIPQSSTQSGQKKFCDVVMKGGITSGVIYPSAIVELSRKFRLKNIGGTSAGAIAAAAAAAAECGEARGTAAGGYKLLAGLTDFLSHKDDEGKTNLLSFFQPQPKTFALFDSLAAGLESEKKFDAVARVLGRALYRFPFWPVLCLAIGLKLFTVESNSLLGFAWLAVAIIFGILLLAGRFVQAFASRIPGADGNYYGLCTGMSTETADDSAPGPSAGGQALTVWLSKYLNELAGLDPDGSPLTFGQLWHPELTVGTHCSEDINAAVKLEMFTTCLTTRRPFRLPFRDEEDLHENRFYFLKSEFDRLFPANVVRWLVEHPRAKSRLDPRWRDLGYFPMPDPCNLPVVVATRLSLSFPILLSAVPLHDYEDVKDVRNTEPPEHSWFSDGGICSNFPIHLFDAPLPRWPTFGINLAERPETATDSELATPWMPASNRQGMQEAWTRFDQPGGLASIVGFIWSIIGTMQNWSDNSLAHMPGYRDRIAQVGLRPSEGGLNLGMTDTQIGKLAERGKAAATELSERFDDAETRKGAMNWANHRWLRFRSLTGSFEDMITRVERTCSEPQPGDIGYEKWVRDVPMHGEPSYSWENAAQRDLAIETLATLRALAKRWHTMGTPASIGAPRPLPELRPRPRL